MDACLLHGNLLKVKCKQPHPGFELGLPILCGVVIIIFYHPNSKCMKDNYEMFIRMLHSLLNRNINIIMDHCCNGNPIDSQIFLKPINFWLYKSKWIFQKIIDSSHLYSYNIFFSVLGSLFYDTSTLVSYSMSEPSFVEEQ